MNPTITLMQSHRSIRSYTDEPVAAEMLAQIIDAARLGPTSINSQQVSLVVETDPQRRAEIARIAGGQPWIAAAPVFITLVVDFNKTRIAVEHGGQQQVIQHSVESLVAGAVDAGITLGNLMTAARSFGLGIVPIGGIRRDPQAMIDLLGLPPLTFPLVGLCIGHIADDAAQKPRLPRASFVHYGRYDGSGLEQMASDYDQTLMQHWQSSGRADGQPWSESVAAYYQKVYFPLVKPVAESQGFGFSQ